MIKPPSAQKLGEINPEYQLECHHHKQNCFGAFWTSNDNLRYCIRSCIDINAKTSQSRSREPTANLYSLIETCKANRIEPYTYLVALFRQLTLAIPVEDFEALLPWQLVEPHIA